MAVKQLAYMENLVGRGKQISVAALAEKLGMERQSVAYRLRKPLSQWILGHIIIVSDLLEYDWEAMIRLAIEYEKEQATTLPASTKGRPKQVKRPALPV